MKKNENSYPLISALTALFLIIASSPVLAAAEQNTSSMVTYAYITNGGSNNVSVIDTATNTVEAAISVGSRPEGVAVSPDGKRVYGRTWAVTLSP